ncbi:DgyrCDS3680 [Dimorphilus gyrociliatus]|uniref:DgyrCDS3680 n=1 Tax=Dimorphilus gyrociliatus TaxID=2664684 RepID=A0A7I8VF50_9ANNE|nr:DgyrCDS3680 [Dimorphilus gyrociliatus]
MGGEKLKLIPIALSILATNVTTIELLGTPAEIYSYGTQFSLQILAMILGNTLASFIVVSGVGVYAASTALHGVSGLSNYITIPVCIGIGTLYTTIGGVRAVIWTDVFQSVVIILSLLYVLTKGIINVGGLKKIWTINSEYKRIEFFNISFDPTERTTFWLIVFVMPILWFCTGALQLNIQRFSMLKTIKEARMSLLIPIPFYAFIHLAASLCGFCAFAYYASRGCDPLKSHQISNPNQILPLFIMEIMSSSGIPGLFIACLFSASLRCSVGYLNVNGFN